LTAIKDMNRKAVDETRLLAAKAVLPRLEALRREIPATRTGANVESLHQMRVASRRLRSALGMFEGVLGKSAKRWRREIRSVTGILGASRDLDVQIEFVEEFLGGLDDPDLERGPRLLLEHLKAERRSAQVRLDGALDDLERSGLLEEVEREIQPLSAGVKAATLGGLLPLRHKWARDAIRTTVKELLRYRRTIARPERVEELHQMRIAAKRLRYVLEAFVARHREELEGALSTATTLQDLLGEIHDCDVWEVSLSEILETNRLGGKATAAIAFRSSDLPKIRAGLERLRENRAQRRKKRYKRLLKIWRELERRSFWKKLLKRLRRSGKMAGKAVRRRSAS
jgi:CHAD domain-containing protein